MHITSMITHIKERTESPKMSWTLLVCSHAKHTHTHSNPPKSRQEMFSSAEHNAVWQRPPLALSEWCVLLSSNSHLEAVSLRTSRQPIKTGLLQVPFISCKLYQKSAVRENMVQDYPFWLSLSPVVSFSLNVLGKKKEKKLSFCISASFINDFLFCSLWKAAHAGELLKEFNHKSIKSPRTALTSWTFSVHTAALWKRRGRPWPFI